MQGHEGKGLLQKCDLQIPLCCKISVIGLYLGRLCQCYALSEVYCDFFISLISQESTNSQTSARHCSMDKTHCLSMQSSMWKRRSLVLSNLEVSVLEFLLILGVAWREFGGRCVRMEKEIHLLPALTLLLALTQLLPWLSIHLLIKCLSFLQTVGRLLERTHLLDNILSHKQDLN